MSPDADDPPGTAELRAHVARRRHDAYMAFFAPVTGRVLPALVDALPGVPGRVADLGSGPGRLARLLLGRGWEVVAVDHDPLMAQEARRAGSTSVVADAGRLPFVPGGFDAVAAAFLLPHVDDVGQHLREAHRVLRPGGALVELGWADTATSPFTGLATQVLDRHAPAAVRELIAEARSRTDPLWLAARAIDAGLEQVEVETVRVVVPLENPGRWWRGMLVASTGLSMLLQLTPADRRRQVEEEFVARADDFVIDGRLEVPAAAILLHARVPGASRSDDGGTTTGR